MSTGQSRVRHCPLAPPTQVRAVLVTEGAAPFPVVQRGVLSKGSTPEPWTSPPADHLAGNTCSQRTSLNRQAAQSSARHGLLDAVWRNRGQAKLQKLQPLLLFKLGPQATPASKGLKTHSHSMALFQRVSVNTRGLLISHSL